MPKKIVFSDDKKYKAIVALVKSGNYHDEWSGAGLFEAIEKIVNDEVHDLSSNGIQNLIKQAERF
jgi:hypothetical protein